jgi:hypothetical protein
MTTHTPDRVAVTLTSAQAEGLIRCAESIARGWGDTPALEGVKALREATGIWPVTEPDPTAEDWEAEQWAAEMERVEEEIIDPNWETDWEGEQAQRRVLLGD